MKNSATSGPTCKKKSKRRKDRSNNSHVKQLSDVNLEPKKTASTRCMEWIQQMPTRRRWSKGGTPSTITILETPEKKHSKRSLLLKSQIKDKILGLQKAHKDFLQTTPQVRCRATRKNKIKTLHKQQGTSNRGHITEQYYKPLSCKKCFLQKWKCRLQPPKTNKKYIYRSKHRTGHYIEKDKRKNKILF